MEQSEIMMDDIPETNPEGFFHELSNQNACSVRVAVRVRPLIGIELKESGQAGQRTCINVNDADNKLLIGEKQFQFDRVFSSDSSQQEIFDVCARNLVLGCFVGYNATILAYGQTGSGKTHTMGTGSVKNLDSESIGIVPRVFEFIFQELDRKKKQSSLSDFTIKISFLELYNEELHDLLDPLTIGAVDRVTGKPVKELFIKEKSGSIFIQGLKEETVNSKEECIELLNKGISHRTTSSTLMNEGSSRSHAIFTIAIEQRIVKEIDVPDGETDLKAGLPGQQEEQITAKFHFVDLAGSERIKRTGAVGQLMKEGISINKGLLCLGNVISALTDDSKKDKHIPYRDSKLTRILQDSLGGNSRTTMIACVSPAETNYEESLNSIKYASRARNIKNKAVVNRDPNSLLIDSLRGQISKLQGEISEYQRVLSDNGVSLPADFQDQVQRKLADSRKAPTRAAPQIDQETAQLMFGSTMGNSQELRELKIKLSKKEQELKSVKETLTSLEEKLAKRDSDYDELRIERDALRLKNELMEQKLQEAGIVIDSSDIERLGKETKKLVDEYKEGMEKLQKELQQRAQEISDTKKKLGELAYQKQIDDQLVNKQVEDIKKLKSQMKKMEASGASVPNSANISPYSQQKGNGSAQPKFKLNLQGVNSDSNQKPEIRNFVIDAEGVQKKIIDNLSIQLDSLFSDENTGQHLQRSPRRSRTPVPEEIVNHPPSGSDDEFSPAENEEALNKNLEDKERILTLAKSSVTQLQSELMEVMKQQYEQQAKQIEVTMRNMDSEKQATLKKTTDSKQIQQIEQQYKQKMEDLARQLQTAKEKEKQKEQMTKQINLNQNKIKNLEDDVQRMRKNKESLEKQMKSETDKHTKFKQKFEKELISAKKAMTDKEREVIKLKQDLKKTDHEMNSKVIELRAMRKRVNEERLRRDIEKQEDMDKKGIDIDRIKVWITQNTDKMLRFREIEEAVTKHNQEKSSIEDEMFQEGDKLDQAMLEKDRKEIEKQQKELVAQDQIEPDEGPILELEEQIYQITIQIDQINERLETLEETYNFHSNKLAQLNGEAVALDAENIEPLKLSGLHSIDAARVTLQTILSILLDVNIYNKDLELKCIELDEQILDLNSSISALQSRVEELTIKLTNQGGSILSDQVALAKYNANKDKVMMNVVSQAFGDFVEYDNIKNLGLTPIEQNTITKLSLSKILKNVKKDLEEEKKRSHNLTMKLEQSLSDKEQYKLKYDNLKKKLKDDLIVKDPLAFQNANQNQAQPSQEPQKQFLSLASARARKQQLSVKGSVDGEPSKPNGSTPVTQGGKYRSRLTVPTKPEDPEAAQNKQGRFAAQGQAQSGRFTTKKPSIAIPSSTKRSRSNSKEDTNSEVKQTSKVPNYMAPLKSKPEVQNPPQIAQVNKKQWGGPTLRPRQPQLMQAAQQEEVQILNHQETAPIDQSQGRVIVPSLKDRRNQRKTGHDDQVNTGKVNLEIDRIKETAQQITSNQSHYDRRESRARDFSKKIQNERAFSSGRVQSAMGMATTPLDMNCLNDLQEDENDDSPRMMKSQIHQQRNTPQQELESNSYGYDEEGSVQEPQEFDIQHMTQKKFMGKWSFEELAEIENDGFKLIGTEVINGQVVLVFDNFMVRQIDLASLEEQQLPFNILEINKILIVNEPAIDFVLDKEIDLIAMATQSSILIFDSNFYFQARIDIGAGIERVVFCQYHIVALMIAEDQIYVVGYQIGDWQELGMYQTEKEGQSKVVLRTDNDSVYLGVGIKLYKLLIPNMQSLFVIETEHQAPIIDMTVTPQAIVTTSLDKSVKVCLIETGEQIMNSLDEFECDHLESCDDFILTRIQGGSQFIILRYYKDAQELDFVEEFDQQAFKQQLEGQDSEFIMKGNILTKFSADPQAPNYNIVLLVTVINEAIFINALKHKPLSEM